MKESPDKSMPLKLLQWATQPGARISDADRMFIDAMRSAARMGVGYGFMQQVIEWEWQERQPGFSWGPEYYEGTIKNLEDAASARSHEQQNAAPQASPSVASADSESGSAAAPAVAAFEIAAICELDGCLAFRTSSTPSAPSNEPNNAGASGVKGPAAGGNNSALAPLSTTQAICDTAICSDLLKHWQGRAEKAERELATERANRDTAARVQCEQANELLKAMGGDPAYSLLDNAKRLRALSAIERNGWILTSEDVPEDVGYVLVYQPDAGSGQRIAAYSFGKWVWQDATYTGKCKPLAWQRIPPFTFARPDGGEQKP